MFYIGIAGLTVQINNKYEYVRRLCRDYILENADAPDITVEVGDDEIQREIDASEISVGPAYCEGICIYRNICRQLPSRFGAFLMHCAVVEYKGAGYAFAAKSGTGKSTHISLWQKRFGDDVKIINGDKPILKFVGDKLYAYGTPWCGKEGFNVNGSVPLKAICFLERGEKNSIVGISPADALTRIFHQVLPPDTLEYVDTMFPLIDRMLSEIPFYVLKCNISEEAAEVAYGEMSK